MDESNFKEKLDKLTDEINTLPADQRKKMEGLVEETKERHTQIKKSIGALQDSLDRLRLSTKYLLFDLEATRRENTYLRKMLDQGEDK
ncbi:MAG: hypothetical protein JEZ07_06260 [Phycisphaerae bacterium]|nr:hypothetical protein [Phycisphaerae bacterium]